MKEIDYFHLDIPIFVPLYKDNVAYSYTGTGGKELLREILCKASDGYCMYCYSRIKIDGKIYAHVEHSVEKYLSKDLENCLSNLGLDCSMCNQSYKRRRELNKDSLPNNVLHYSYLR